MYSSDCDIHYVEDCNHYFEVDLKPRAPTNFLPITDVLQVLARLKLISPNKTARPFSRICNWIHSHVKLLNEIHSDSCLHLTSMYLLTSLKMHEATLLASFCILYMLLVGLQNPHVVPSLINVTIRYKKIMVPNLGPCRFHFNTSWTKGRRGVALVY